MNVFDTEWEQEEIRREIDEEKEKTMGTHDNAHEEFDEEQILTTEISVEPDRVTYTAEVLIMLENAGGPKFENTRRAFSLATSPREGEEIEDAANRAVEFVHTKLLEVGAEVHKKGKKNRFGL